MGKYAFFIWSSYGAAVLLLGGVALVSLLQLRRLQADLRDLE